MNLFASARRRRLCAPLLEALESRIAPATVVLPAGDGPFTLEVDPADSHLHLTNGSGAEIFDQGTATGDSLTITGSGVGDQLDIKTTAAGSVSCSMSLDVDINGPIHVDSALSAPAGISLLSTGFNITTSASIQATFGTVILQAANGIAINDSIIAGGAVSLNADYDNDNTGIFASTNAPVTAGGGIIDIKANTILLASALSTSSGGDITLSADTMDLTANITAGAGEVTLKQHTSAWPINLGSEIGSALSLTDAELDYVSAATLSVGDSSSGAITISADLTSAVKLHLVSAAGLSGTGALTLAANTDLFVQTGGDVSLSGAIVTPRIAQFTAVGGAPFDVTLNNPGNDFTVVDVHGARSVSLRDDNGFQVSIGASSLISLESAGFISQLGPLDGGAALFKAGTGTLQLSLLNTLGAMTIRAGTITFGNANSLGSGTITLGDSSTGGNDVALLATPGGQGVDLQNDIVVPSLLGDSVATLGTTAAAAGHIHFNGSLTLDRPTVFSSASSAPEGDSDVFVNGAISGSVSQITIGGGRRVTLTGANTFSGDVQVVGTDTILELAGASDVIPDASTVVLGPNTTLRIANTSGTESINSLFGSGKVTTNPSPFGSPQTLTIGANGGSFTFDGIFEEGSGALSLTKAGEGTATLRSESTYTGATIIAGGTLAFSNSESANLAPNSGSIEIQAGAFLSVIGLGNGNAPQTLVLANAQQLHGSGTLTGSLGGGGFVEPGSAAAPGILTIDGDLNSAGSLIFRMDGPYVTAGTDFDQIVVGGDVNLSDASLYFLGGLATPPDGQTVKLIDHTGNNPSIGSNTPKEGGFAAFGNSVFTVSYQGGDSNDLVLTKAIGTASLTASLVGGKLTITDTDAVGRFNFLTYFVLGSNVVIADTVELFTAAPAGGQLINGGHAILLPRSAITKGIVVNGGGADDVLTVDFSRNATALPTGGITFDGGTQATPAGDQLTVLGDNQGSVTFNYSGATGGSVSMTSFGKVTYTGLEQLLDSGSTTSAIFNLPAVLNNVYVGDGRLSGNTIVQTDFADTTGAVTLNRGSAEDVLTLQDVFSDNDVTIGSPAKPFKSVLLNGPVDVQKAFNLSALNFSLSAGQTMSAASGTLSFGAGTLEGAIGGGLGIAKIYDGNLILRSTNTYTGETVIQKGPLIVASPMAAQNSTIRLLSDFGLQFGNDITGPHLGGLAGTGDLPLADAIGQAVTLEVGNNNADTIYSGSLSGPGNLDKVGAGTLTLTGVNTQAGTIVESGVLQANSDRALGHLGDALTFRGGTLHATASFITPRAISLEASATFEASEGKTLTLSGLISGNGNLLIGNTGAVLVTNAANTNTGTTEIGSSTATVVNGVTISTPGAHGDIIVTPGATPNTIASIDLTGTNVPISLTIKSPLTGTVTVEKIISNDTTVIKTITLGANVILGDGAADSIPDLVVNGKLTNLQIADVSANTIIQLGKGLTYLETYKNAPNVTLRDVLGPGVVLDVSGLSSSPAGMGGGGLGKIVVNSWSAPGIIKTSQGIKSLVVKNGDANVSLEVDPNHLGAATVANVGLVSVPNGSWAGTGMQVEGTIAQFLTKGLKEGAVISAGAFGTVKIKGAYAGSIISTADPSVVVLVKGKPKVIATGGIGSVNISSGDFTGLINANGKVGNITLTGSAAFMGTVRGGSIGNITAGSFTGTPLIDGVRQSITAIGSIGNITAIAGSLTDYLIAAGADLGSDAQFGGAADSFSSYTTNTVTHVNTIVSIGAVTIKGDVTGTTIAAGVDPGAGGLYGDGNDLVVARPPGLITKTKIGALKFAATNLNLLGVADSAAYSVGNAFEAQTLTSLQFGTGKTTATLLKQFDTAHYIDSGATSIIVRLLT